VDRVYVLSPCTANGVPVAIPTDNLQGYLDSGWRLVLDKDSQPVAAPASPQPGPPNGPVWRVLHGRWV